MSTLARAAPRSAARSAARKKPAEDARAGAIAGRVTCAVRRTRLISQLSCRSRRESNLGQVREARTPDDWEGHAPSCPKYLGADSAAPSSCSLGFSRRQHKEPIQFFCSIKV